MKIKKQNRRYLYLVILFLCVVAAVSVYATEKDRLSQNTQKANQQTSKIFKSSDLLKFEIVVPEQYLVTEKLGSVKIFSKEGEIYIDRNATNLENLNDYINNLDQINKSQYTETDKFKSDYELSARVYKKSDGSEQKEYIIYIDGWVYNLFTNSKNLFSDLNNIAKSFKYIP